MAIGDNTALDPPAQDWDTTPPGRPELAQANHDLRDTCNVVRLGVCRDAPDEDALMLETEQLAQRWGCHPETIKRAVRNGTCPLKPILPHGKWFFSRAAIERTEMATARPYQQT